MQELEKKKYEEIWRHPQYRVFSPGFYFAENFLNHFKAQMSPGESIIDFGCGTGKAGFFFFLQGFEVHMVDIAMNCLDESIANFLSLHPPRIDFLQACLWELPEALEKTDWIYCCDVLEHIPTQHVDDVLFQIAQRCKKGGFLEITLEQDSLGALIGQELHLTVRSKEWWMEKINRHWKIDAFGPEKKNMRFSIFVKTMSI